MGQETQSDGWPVQSCPLTAFPVLSDQLYCVKYPRSFVWHHHPKWVLVSPCPLEAYLISERHLTTWLWEDHHHVICLSFAECFFPPFLLVKNSPQRDGQPVSLPAVEGLFMNAFDLTGRAEHSHSRHVLYTSLLHSTSEIFRRYLPCRAGTFGNHSLCGIPPALLLSVDGNRYYLCATISKFMVAERPSKQMSMPLAAPQMPKICSCNINGINLCHLTLADVCHHVAVAQGRHSQRPSSVYPRNRNSWGAQDQPEAPGLLGLGTHWHIDVVPGLRSPVQDCTGTSFHCLQRFPRAHFCGQSTLGFPVYSDTPWRFPRAYICKVETCCLLFWRTSGQDNRWFHFSQWSKSAIWWYLFIHY